MGKNSNSFLNRPSTFILVLTYAIGYGLYVLYRSGGTFSNMTDVILVLIGFLGLPLAGGIIATIVSVILDIATRKPIKPFRGFNFVVSFFITALIAGEILNLVTTPS